MAEAALFAFANIAPGTFATFAAVAVFGAYDVLTLELSLAATVVGLCTVPGSWSAA